MHNKLHTIEGTYFIKWLRDSNDILRPEQQGIINQIVGDHLFVTYFSWLDGSQVKHRLEPLKRFTEGCELHVNKEQFVERCDKLSALHLNQK